MNSLFKLNQLSAKQHPPILKGESLLDERDKEIYALTQQLQALKTLYKNAKNSLESPPKKFGETSPENNYSKQRIEKLMAVLAEREKQMRTQQQEAKQQLAEAIDEWQKEKQAKQVALEEVAALRAQLEFLKAKIKSNQSA